MRRGLKTHPDSGNIGAAASVRFGALTLAWGGLTGGEGFWPWGVAAAAAVALVSLSTLEPRRGRFRSALRLLRLAPMIIRESLLGGWDVAYRALSVRRTLRPRFEVVRLEESDIPVATALAYAITLMPGTLAVEVEKQRLLIHVIDYRRDDCRAIKTLEGRLVGLIGERP